MSNYAKALIAIIIASLIWSTAGITGKILLVHFHPFFLALLRSLVASFFIFPIFIRQKRPPIKRMIRDVGPIALLSGFNILFFYFGLERTTADASAVIYGVTPLLVSVIAALTIGERPTTQKIAGIFVGLIGICFILLLPSIGKGGAVFGTLPGNLLLLIAVGCWASYTVGSRYLTTAKQYSPFIITSLTIFATAALLIIVNLFWWHAPNPAAFTDPVVLALLLYIGVAMTIVTYLLFQWAIKNSSSSTASLTHYLQPVFAFYFAWILLGERLTPEFIFGSLLVLLGVFIATGSQVVKRVRKHFGRS